MDSSWLLAVAIAGAVVLGGLWVVHLRAHLDRRGAHASEWADDGGGGEDLWTSSARCIRCHASPVVLSRDGGQLWHECIACGHREARENFG